MKIILITLAFIVPSLQLEAPTTQLLDVSDEQIVRVVFEDKADRMLDIAECESNRRQFDDKGNVITSHTNDSGYFQINSVWDKKAQELNLDYKNSLIDNIKMAKHIYDVQGEEAWVCSRKV